MELERALCYCWAARAWEPVGGQIRLDGRDLREYSAEALTSTIGVRPQNSYIFSATVRDNLRLGRPAATDADMYLALRTVGLHGHLLDEWVGDQGARLSGGERERLALAQALLLDVGFLLLDEPTANLDRVAERAITRVIRSASRTRGVLLVTHRVADLDWLDEVLVLDDGRVVERGQAAELRRAGGLYARLLNVQQQLLYHDG